MIHATISLFIYSVATFYLVLLCLSHVTIPGALIFFAQYLKLCWSIILHYAFLFSDKTHSVPGCLNKCIQTYKHKYIAKNVRFAQPTLSQREYKWKGFEKRLPILRILYICIDKLIKVAKLKRVRTKRLALFEMINRCFYFGIHLS